MGKKKMRTSDKVLIVIAIILISFTITNLVIFTKMGMVPDTLITVVFSAALGEFGFLAWIRNTKQKYPDSDEYEEEE